MKMRIGMGFEPAVAFGPELRDQASGLWSW